MFSCALMSFTSERSIFNASFKGTIIVSVSKASQILKIFKTMNKYYRLYALIYIKQIIC